MRETAGPINWMVMGICMRTRTEMICAMPFYDGPPIVAYLCQAGIATMLSAGI